MVAVVVIGWARCFPAAAIPAARRSGGLGTGSGSAFLPRFFGVAVASSSSTSSATLSGGATPSFPSIAAPRVVVNVTLWFLLLIIPTPLLTLTPEAEEEEATTRTARRVVAAVLAVVRIDFEVVEHDAALIIVVVILSVLEQNARKRAKESAQFMYFHTQRIHTPTRPREEAYESIKRRA